MDTKTIGIAVVALLVGFGAGYLMHPAPAPQMMAGGFNRTPGDVRGAGGMAGGFLTGTVAAKDATSITLNTRDGSSHVVLLSPSTSVAKSVTGALTDVSVGSTIMVVGTTNSNGSISASNIQLNPATSTPRAQ